jgi:hypothetical protein
MKVISSNRWGCGIHSPYVYSLVSRVIYGTEFRCQQQPAGWKKPKRSIRHYLDVTGRLIRFFRPELIVITGQKEESGHLVEKIFPDIPVLQVGEATTYVPESNHEFVIWDEIPDKIPQIPGPLYKSIWILRKGLGARMNFLMNELRFSEKVSVTLNLQHTGIVIFNKDLQKENFVIRRII